MACPSDCTQCNCDQCNCDNAVAVNPPGCNEIPVVRHPSTASGDCAGLDNHKIKAGMTADWVLPAGAFQAKNPDTDWWEDEVTTVFVTTESDEFILLS